MTLLIDIGSTFTKLVAVDGSGEVLAASRAPTTVQTDVNDGLRSVLEEAERQAGRALRDEAALLCSSAAGGLRMAVAGLVPSLTTEAARRAALGAGAKIIATYSYELTPDAVDEICALAPDIVLLAGGTDGGDQEVILHNAHALVGRLSRNRVVLAAGNRVAVPKVREIFAREASAPKLYVAENILPEVQQLNVEPARAAIRDIFLERIVDAKGVHDIPRTLPRGRVLMPTPLAVMRAAELLASGTDDQPGMGDTVILDIGGATTDVHSVGEPVPEGRIVRGLTELFAKRTVEGDLGVRINCRTVAGLISQDRLLRRLPEPGRWAVTEADIEGHASFFSQHTGAVAQTAEQVRLDLVISIVAGALALERHVGRLETVPTPQGRVEVQVGKDLSHTRLLIGTGGVFGYPDCAGTILDTILHFQSDPQALRPVAPTLRYDARYGLFAAGLLGEIDPSAAFRLAQSCLEDARVKERIG